jgi:hypothetical protein
MAGYKYFWTCPACGTELQLKMRVTQTKRKCPHCGFQVTPEEIDRQNRVSPIPMAIIGIGLLFMCALFSTQGEILKIAPAMIGLLVLGLIGFVVYAIYSGRRTDVKIGEFRLSPDYQVVRDFVRSDMYFEDGTREKLHDLLNQRGWVLQQHEVNDLVDKEWEEYFQNEQTEWFTKQLREKNLSRREEYVKAYAQLTHPHEDTYIHVLASFLKVGETEYRNLKEEVAKLSINPDLDEFERRLQG